MKGHIASRYEALCSKRSNALHRARRAAQLTIPYLMPEWGAHQDAEYYTPYQSVGAEGVSNMASKLGLSFFNPSSPFIRLEADELALRTLGQLPPDQAAQFKQDLEATLKRIERSVTLDFEAQGHRSKFITGLELLLVTGHILIYAPEDGTMRIFRLDQFVIAKDPMGNLLEAITEEVLAPNTLSQEHKELLLANDALPTGDEETVKLHTYLKRIGEDRWMLAQEVNGVLIPDSMNEFPSDRNPFIDVPLFQVPTETYGRGLVEKVIGDLQTLETLSQALEEGTVASARMIIGLRPGSVASPKELAEAPNTSIVVMDPEDAKAIQFDKRIDLATAQQWAGIVQDRLERNFLLVRSVQRSGERVTATEINALVLEIESAHAGLQSSLDAGLVRPLGLRIIETLKQRKLIPPLPRNNKYIRPRVITGFEGIGRAQDLQRILGTVQSVSASMPPDLLVTYIDWKAVLKAVQTASGLDFDFVKSDEVIAQEQQQAQAQAAAQTLLEKGTPAVAKGVADTITASAASVPQ